jgi:hypothetical protein
MSEHQPNNFQKRLSCPKGMKLPKSVKLHAALRFATDSEMSNYFMKTTGIAIHEAVNKRKESARRESRVTTAEIVSTAE